jgi:hypothetical protein
MGLWGISSGGSGSDRTGLQPALRGVRGNAGLTGLGLLAWASQQLGLTSMLPGTLPEWELVAESAVTRDFCGAGEESEKVKVRLNRTLQQFHGESGA